MNIFGKDPLMKGTLWALEIISKTLTVLSIPFLFLKVTEYSNARLYFKCNF